MATAFVAFYSFAKMTIAAFVTSHCFAMVATTCTVLVAVYCIAMVGDFTMRLVATCIWCFLMEDGNYSLSLVELDCCAVEEGSSCFGRYMYLLFCRGLLFCYGK